MARRRTHMIVLGLLRNAVRGRLALREVERELARREPAAPGTYRVAVHFPDHPVNLYQLRQWYEPLRRLAQEHPVVVVARYASAARALLRECPVPVVLARSIAEVEVLLGEHPVRAVLYVNQNSRNFSVMRYRQPAHVFICHGESDKDYMVSNQLKAYDVALIAGPAAADRLAAGLIDYDVERRTVQVGRPQVDVTYQGPDLPDDGRRVVLYAPTWEGDRPSMSYSSVVSHGERLVTALLADPQTRVVVRPHPRTGSVDPDAGRALHRIQRLLDAANRADPQARHLFDTATPFGWHLAAADVCLTDISAIAYDWIATAKPLVITAPAAPEAVVDHLNLVDRADLLPAEQAARIGEVLSELTGTDHAAVDQRRRAERYYGDVSPGASMRRFLTAVADVVQERERVLTARRG